MSDQIAGPWLTAKEAAAYVRCASVNSFYMWYRAHFIVPRYKGRSLLFDRKDLDRALKAKPAPKRIHPNSLKNLRRRYEAA